jgi:nucleoside-diphosphate-sugar epimerase
VINVKQVTNEEQLEDLLSTPCPEDTEFARQLGGHVLVLGAGGKMGPTLVTRIMRALVAAQMPFKVYAVSRFTDTAQRRKLEAWGAVTIAADLLEEDMLAARLADLPHCPNVIYMAGMKFGTSGHEDLTWAMNAYMPGRVAERFRSARIVAFSTGNVYPLVDVHSDGSKETDPTGPIGEYAQSCLGRERVLHYFSLKNATPMCFLRLNYAVEPRYGVLLDIATKVYASQPVVLAMGYVNVIWQGDANSVALRSLGLCKSPPQVLNVTGLETLSVRRLAEEFAERLGRKAVFEGKEGRTALLSDASRCRDLLGAPHTPIGDVMDLVAYWVKIGGPTLNKPTKFEVRDGRF